MTLKEVFNKRFQSAPRNEELGYTDKVGGAHQRVLHQHGDFNVVRLGIKTKPFQYMINVSWAEFVIRVLVFYTGINLVFASLYMAIDPNGIGFNNDYEVKNHFLIAVFFSAQTITTVGYGSLYPVSSTVSIIAATEALLGLMIFAIITGVLYGRFSKPVPGIKFSRNALIAPYKDGWSLQFRVANSMRGDLMNLEAKALLSVVVTEGEKQIRRFQPLHLDNNKISYLTINWTCVHPIDEKSPLWGMSEEDFSHGNLEIIVMVGGYNDTYGQDVHARSSYTAAEIQWHRKFKIPYYFNEDGVTMFDIRKLEESEPVPV